MTFVPVVASTRPVVRSQDWAPLRDEVQARTGVHYPDSQLGLLAERLSPRLKSMDAAGAEDLVLRLRYDESQQEVRWIRDLAAPHDSSFFRERESLDAAVKWLRQRGRENGVARIWSAGCARGEEPWSLAYLWSTEQEPSGTLELRATELSVRCVEEARRGEYRASLLGDVPLEVKNQLFEPGMGHLRVRDAWRTGVCFEVGNLLEPADFPEQGYDVVMCRNVLLYFGEQARKEAAAVFHERLSDGGLLFLGHSESLHGVSRDFRAVNLGRCLAYRKD